MPTTISGENLTHETLWKAMGILLNRSIHSLDRDSFMEEALDTLLSLFGAHRAAILLTNSKDGENFLACSRGNKRNLSFAQQEEISRTIIKKAQRTEELVIFRPDQIEEFTESMKMCNIYTALAIPLFSQEWKTHKGSDSRIKGVLYLDFRSFETVVGPLHISFFEAAANLISAAIEQREKREAVLKKLNKQKNKTLSLDEILAPKSQDLLKKQIDALLGNDLPILITGESGTGKTMLATAIANATGKSTVVRATLGLSHDLNTISSELFGHLKGSYSGAISNRTGLVEQAHGGVLILDEILNLPLNAQQLLLDFTQFGTYRPLGWDKKDPKKSSCRVISVTNGHIKEAVQQNQFRMDLYYRIAAIHLNISPLRNRQEDIPGLALSFLRKREGGKKWKLHIDLRKHLVSGLDWPGNIRQLEAMTGMACERALLEDPLATTIFDHHFFTETPPENTKIKTGDSPPDPTDLKSGVAWLKERKESLGKYEKELIDAALKKYGGTVAHAARELEIPRTSLISRMQTLKISPPQKPKPPTL
jgi:DNA-binding NtrC family response regulator